MVILENEPMSMHTSFKVGGPAHFFVKADHLDDLKSALALAREKKLPYFILGNGTNLLVADRGYDGIVISLAADEEVKAVAKDFADYIKSETLADSIEEADCAQTFDINGHKTGIDVKKV